MSLSRLWYIRKKTMDPKYNGLYCVWKSKVKASVISGRKHVRPGVAGVLTFELCGEIWESPECWCADILGMGAANGGTCCQKRGVRMASSQQGWTVGLADNESAAVWKRTEVNNPDCSQSSSSHMRAHTKTAWCCSLVVKSETQWAPFGFCEWI